MFVFVSPGHWVPMAFPWQIQDVLKAPFGTRGLVIMIPKIVIPAILGQIPMTWLENVLKTTWSKSFA